jgi:hypothetical protein
MRCAATWRPRSPRARRGHGVYGCACAGGSRSAGGCRFRRPGAEPSRGLHLVRARGRRHHRLRPLSGGCRRAGLAARRTGHGRATRRPDVSRSAAGRGGAEAIGGPTALLPRFGVSWSADDARLTARHRLGPVPVEINLDLDPEGRVRSVVFDRWADPDKTGTWASHRSAVRTRPTVASPASPSRARGGWDGISARIGGEPASSSGTRSPACRSLHARQLRETPQMSRSGLAETRQGR